MFALSSDESKLNCEIQSATWRAVSLHFVSRKLDSPMLVLWYKSAQAVEVGNHEGAICSRFTSGYMISGYWGPWILKGYLLLPSLAANKRNCLMQLQKDKIFLWINLKRGKILVCTRFMHAILCMCAYLCTWGSWLFGCCRAEPWSNWADIRLWLILLMSTASRGEDTERKNCQTKTQVTSFIPPRLLASSLPLCTHRKGFSAPLVHCWLHHCLLRLLSLLQVCHCLI